MAKMSKDYAVPALDKAITILNALAEADSMNITEIHSRLQIPKSSTFVIMNTLERHDFVARSEDGKYRLGYGLFRLGMSFGNNIDLRTMAQPFLRELVQGTPYTGHLAVLHDRQAVYIHKEEGGGFVRFATSIGQSVPLHLSGVGKSLLSGFGDDDIVRMFADEPPVKLTEKSLNSVDELLEEIHFIREHGYIIEDEQMEQGIRCVGAPIYGNEGRVIASISITALSRDLPAVKFQTIGEQAKEAAKRISDRISI